MEPATAQVAGFFVFARKGRGQTAADAKCTFMVWEFADVRSRVLPPIRNAGLAAMVDEEWALTLTF